MHASVRERSEAVRAAEGSPEPEQGGSSSAEMPPEPVEPSDVDGDGVADEEDCEELVHDAGSEDASIGEAEELPVSIHGCFGLTLKSGAKVTLAV